MSKLYDKQLQEEQFYDERLDKNRRHISKQIAIAILQSCQKADLLLNILAYAYSKGFVDPSVVETLFDKLGFSQEDYAAISNNLEEYMKICKKSADHFSDHEDQLRYDAAIDAYESLYA